MTKSMIIKSNRALQKSLVLLLSAFALSSLSYTQKQRPRHSNPVPVPPQSCALTVVTMKDVTGSNAYVPLRYVIEALSSAQEAVSGMAASLKQFDAATSPTLAMATLLTGTHQAQDADHCAAFLINQYPANDDDDKIIKAIYVASFNREADALADLMSHTKEQFLRSAAATQANAVRLRDAERFAAMEASQNKAATDILQTTHFVLMKSVDLSEPGAKTTPYLAVTCAEYADLIKRNAPLAHADKSAYTEPATLIQEVLDDHKCRQ